ncbi:hypothetical protein FF38_12841 [Lucilia cuprina]|uniref:FLYWCH-type domain-containing protein n=1 Tax=Lucilia cuprina TaxID=7375 RepID=A0A0L0CH80_LUCCU|nr:hypothetical protein FF38_12841 [Lucilia cuprina]
MNILLTFFYTLKLLLIIFLFSCLISPLVGNFFITYITGFRGSRKLKVGDYTFTRNKASGNKTYWSCARAGGIIKVEHGDFSFINGQRGCTLLAYKGYNFVKNRKSGVKTYWICAKKGSLKCNARVVTDVVNGITQIVLESCHHNHSQLVTRKKRKSTAIALAEALLNENTKLVQEINYPKFITGQGGCQILMYKNEKFVKNRKTDTRTYWICSKKNATICRARLVTGRDVFGLERIFQYNCKHNHTPKNPFTKLQAARKDRKNFDITLCRARIVTGRDSQGLERIIQRTFEHNHTRKYPDHTIRTFQYSVANIKLEVTEENETFLHNSYLKCNNVALKRGGGGASLIKTGLSKRKPTFLNSRTLDDWGNIKYTDTARGNKLLYFEGHRFIKNNIYGSNIYWKCSKWHSNCKARAITSLEVPSKSFRIDFIDSKKNGGKLLVINGFRFFRNKKHGSRQYWKCSNYYKEKCPAIAIYDENTLNLRLCHQHRHVSSNDIEIKPFLAKEHNMMESSQHGQYKGKHPKIQFSVSKRGGQLLWLDGLKYFRNNENRTNLFWRCHWYYRRIRCPVLICMNKFDINDFRQIHKHCHIKSANKQTNKLNAASRQVQTNQNDNNGVTNEATNNTEEVVIVNVTHMELIENAEMVLANDVVPNPEDVLIFFTQSLRGRPAIMANGVRFLIMSENKKKILWRCSSMATKKIKCPARITMLKETPPKFIINKAEHIHAELKRNKYGATKNQVYNLAKIKAETVEYDNTIGLNISTTLNTLDDIHYVTSQKGRTQLVHKGYYYVREKKVRNKVYWRCTQYTTWFHCHGRLHTDEGRIVHSSSHNHGRVETGEKPNMRKLKKIKIFNQHTQPVVTATILPPLTLTVEHNTKKKNRKLIIRGFEFVVDRQLKQSTNWRCSRYKSAHCKARATTRINTHDSIYFVMGQRGKPKLVVKGYAFIRNKTTAERLYWNCAHTKSNKCRAHLEQLARKSGITITRGSKGKPKLVLAGYAYFRNNVKGSKTYWLCAKNRCNRYYFVLNYPLEQNIINSIQYVKGQRGSRKMVCGGYSYICAKIKKGRKYWVCAKQRSRNCKARLITDLEEVEFYTRNITHNHVTDVNRITLLKDLQ